MRVIAGQYGGRRINVPKGLSTRPTTDRVRESLMSSLASMLGSFEALRVLDAFAGSGALGIEALSRGASHAVFCECDPRAFAVLSANLSFLPKDSYDAIRSDVLKRAPSKMGPYDLVFLDPPYALGTVHVQTLLNNLEVAGALSERVVVTYEHAASNDFESLKAHGSLQLERVGFRQWGDTVIETYRKVT